jgi:hypothetical protein
MSETFQTTEPTTLGRVIPAYVFVQYNDDVNIQAYFAAFNALAQNYATWFQNLNLPIYTGGYIAGPLLDWVGQGIYGLKRPYVPNVANRMIGPFDTTPFNTIPFNALKWTSPGGVGLASDDLYRRMMTWRLYKGDGKNPGIHWLKRRTQRYLTGLNGVDPGVQQTYDISVQQDAPLQSVTITIPNGPVAAAFEYGIATGALEVPFQFAFKVNIAGGPSFENDGGVLALLYTVGVPTSSTGVAFWNNSGLACVGATYVANPVNPSLYFNSITLAELLDLNAYYLASSAGITGSGLLWDNGGVICIS